MNLRRWLAFLLPAVGGRAEPLSVASIEALRVQVRVNFFVDPAPVPDATVHRRFAPAKGVKAEAVTYATTLGARVPAILYLPDPLPKETTIPAFIVVNGHGGDKFAWYAYYTGVAFACGGKVSPFLAAAIRRLVIQ